MSHTASRTVPAVAATLALLLAAAACPAATQWYTVELIVFQHLSADGLYTESWPEEPGEPDVNSALRLTASGDLPLADETDGISAGAPYAFQLLDGAELELLDVSNRLKWSEGYRPLLHLAWRQPGFSRSQARPVHVHSALPNRFRNADTAAGGLGGVPQLSGTLRLSRARYLHVDADFLHHRPGSAVAASRFRLRQSRRMRSRELHYLDHPSFGLLVRVTPYEPVELYTDEEAAAPEPEAGETQTGE